MTDPTPDLAELRRLAEAATPGPWSTAAFQLVIDVAQRIDVGMCGHRDDAAFIAAANPAVVLALLDVAAERDALAAKVERVRALHIAHDCTSHAGIATICAHRPGICLACLKPLPCPTIRALDTTPDTGGES